MAKNPPSPFPFPPKRMYWGAKIPMRVIRRYARAIAEEFHPEKVILSGSYAYGTPHADSDVLAGQASRSKIPVHSSSPVRFLLPLRTPAA